MLNVQNLPLPAERPGSYHRERAVVDPSSPVCRCLFGPVNHAETRELLVHQLTRVDDESRCKWDFDFTAEKPLPGKGNVDWTPVEEPSAMKRNIIYIGRLRLRPNYSSREDCDALSRVRQDFFLSPSSSSSTTSSSGHRPPSPKQTSITDFYRCEKRHEEKRKSSSSDDPEEETVNKRKKISDFFPPRNN